MESEIEQSQKILKEHVQLEYWEIAKIIMMGAYTLITLIFGTYVYQKTRSITHTKSKAIIIYFIVGSFGWGITSVIWMFIDPRNTIFYLVGGMSYLIQSVSCNGGCMLMLSFRKYQLQLNAHVEDTRKIIQSIDQYNKMVCYVKISIVALIA